MAMGVDTLVAWPKTPRSCEGSNRNGDSSYQRRDKSKHDEKGFWGNILKCKHKGTTRVLLHNVGGIGFITNERSREIMKMERLKKFTIEHLVYLACLTEVNKNWRLTNEENTIWNGIKGWRRY